MLVDVFGHFLMCLLTNLVWLFPHLSISVELTFQYSTHVHKHTHIYIYRERESVYIYIYVQYVIYIYIYRCIYMYIYTLDDKVLDASALGGRRLEISCSHLKLLWVSEASCEGLLGGQGSGVRVASQALRTYMGLKCRSASVKANGRVSCSIANLCRHMSFGFKSSGSAGAAEF